MDDDKLVTLYINETFDLASFKLAEDWKANSIPRTVSEAVILKTLSYQEAWERGSWTLESLYAPCAQKIKEINFETSCCADLFWCKCFTSSHNISCDAIWHTNLNKEYLQPLCSWNKDPPSFCY